MDNLDENQTDEGMKYWLWAILIAVVIGGVRLLVKDQTETPPSTQSQMTQPTTTPQESPKASVPQYQYQTTPTFHGYDCTDDCSGHEAGYEWAEENDIGDPDDCGGNSDSFIEGCQAYAEEIQVQVEDERMQQYDDSYPEQDYPY